MDAQETRRLHELAARAIGLSGDYRYCEAWKCMATWNDTDGGWFDWRSAWRPLADDGDSRRLEVALHMGVQSNGPDHWQSPNCTIVIFDTADCPSRLKQDHAGDPCAATRLAVLRAAAAIGEAMQERGAA